MMRQNRFITQNIMVGLYAKKSKKQAFILPRLEFKFSCIPEETFK